MARGAGSYTDGSGLAQSPARQGALGRQRPVSQESRPTSPRQARCEICNEVDQQGRPANRRYVHPGPEHRSNTNTHRHDTWSHEPQARHTRAAATNPARGRLYVPASPDRRCHDTNPARGRLYTATSAALQLQGHTNRNSHADIVGMAVSRKNRGAPVGIRTPNLLIRSQMLYPLSYRRVIFDCTRRVVGTNTQGGPSVSGGCGI